MASRSKQYYDANPTAKAKKKKYDTSYHSSPERRKYRSKLNQIRRKLGIYGKGGGDVSHTADGGYKIEDPSVNRGRQGSNKKTTKAKQGLKTRDPKVGTGKKPKGSDRRLYTDENPKDTVSIKFATPSDARATVSKVMKIAKPFARKIQILTVGEQRAKVMGKSEVVSIFKAGKEKLRAQNKTKAKLGLKIRNRKPGKKYEKISETGETVTFRKKTLFGDKTKTYKKRSAGLTVTSNADGNIGTLVEKEKYRTRKKKNRLSGVKGGFTATTKTKKYAGSRVIKDKKNVTEVYLKPYARKGRKMEGSYQAYNIKTQEKKRTSPRLQRAADKGDVHIQSVVNPEKYSEGLFQDMSQTHITPSIRKGNKRKATEAKKVGNTITQVTAYTTKVRGAKKKRGLSKPKKRRVLNLITGKKNKIMKSGGVVKAKSGLAKWFAEDWVDIGSKKKGGGHKKCGRSGKDKSGRPYPKCVPASKAARMTASQKASAVRRKRAAGNPGGKPTNVKTFAKQGIKISFKQNSDNMSKLEKRTTKKKVVRGSGTGEPKKPGFFKSKPKVFTTDTGVKAIKNRKGEVENLSLNSITPYLNPGLTPTEKRQALSSLQGTKKLANGGKTNGRKIPGGMRLEGLDKIGDVFKVIKGVKSKAINRTIKTKFEGGDKEKNKYRKDGSLKKSVTVTRDKFGVKKRTITKTKKDGSKKVKQIGGYAQPYGNTKNNPAFMMYKKGGKSFEPHMMYDPKTGKGFKANKPADHVRMSKMGYTHTKPKKKAGMGMKNKTYLYGGMVPKLGPAKKFISDSAPFSTAVDKYYRSNK